MRWWGVLLVVLAASCRPAVETPFPGPPALRAWWADPDQITSVTGIAFRNPSNAPESLLVDGTLDLARLAEIQTARAILPGMEGADFGEFLFSAEREVLVAACYIPHHVFLLGNARGETIGVVEVCFACRRIRTLPDYQGTIRPDWIALASVCESAGLGMGPTYESAAAFAEEVRGQSAR